MQKFISFFLLLIPAIPLVLFPTFIYPYISSKVFVFRIICWVIFIPTLILGLKNFSLITLKNHIPLTLFLSVVAVANIFGIDPHHSFWGDIQRFNGLVELLYLSVMYVAMTLVMTPKRWMRLINISLITSTVIAIDATIVVLGGSNSVISILGNSLFVGNYLMINFFLCLFMIIKQRKRALLGLLPLFLIAILYTQSRGAMLGLSVGILTLAYHYGTRRLMIAIIAILSLLAIIYLSLHERGFGLYGPRVFLWEIALENYVKRPWLGHGQDNFYWIYYLSGKSHEAFTGNYPDRVHNAYLGWLLSAGIIGLLAYLNLLRVVVSRLLQSNQHVLLAGFIAYMVQNFFLFDVLIMYIYFFSLLAFINKESNTKLV